MYDGDLHGVLYHESYRQCRGGEGAPLTVGSIADTSGI